MGGAARHHHRNGGAREGRAIEHRASGSCEKRDGIDLHHQELIMRGEIVMAAVVVVE